MSLRVLHVIDTSSIGGGQTAVRHLLDGFRGSDVTTELACSGGGPLVEAALMLGATVHSIGFDKRFLPSRARDLARVLRDRRIDVLHTHGLLATYYGEVARTVFGPRVPLVYHQHGFHHRNHRVWTRRARMAAERWLAGRADAVIAVSSSDRRQLLAGGYAAESRLRVIHYGLPHSAVEPGALEAARRAMGIQEGATVVGLVGRLHQQKGIDTFLRAWALVRRERPDAVCAIVGVGELESDLRGLAATLGLGSDLRWVTDGTAGVAAIPAFSVGVLASRWEGLPLVLLEYMAARRPIVTTTVDGCVDAVGPEQAELVPVDEPHAMAAAVLRLLSDPALACRRAAAACARFQDAFTLPVMTRQVRDLYGEVLR